MELVAGAVRRAAVALPLAAAVALSATGCGAESSDATAGDSSGESTRQPGASASSKGGSVGIEAIDAFVAKQSIDTSKEGWRTRLPEPPEVGFDPEKTYYWKLETNVGDMKFRLLPDVAPMHVSSTIYLTRLGFYDGLSFHRIIDGFMAQGGDPLGNGRGGPGYKYAGEFDRSVRHDRPGLLSMANAGPGTDGSQFFITFVPTPHLDGKHTIFGELVEGRETLEALEQRGSRSGRPSEPLRIEEATIVVQ
jgi:peptidyl-prolyl cis-trans isomerase B (cyclophilin B)